MKSSSPSTRRCRRRLSRVRRGSPRCRRRRPRERPGTTPKLVHSLSESWKGKALDLHMSASNAGRFGAIVRPSWSHHGAVSGYNDQLFLRALDLNLQLLCLYYWTLVGVVLGPCVATWTHNADPLGHLGGFLNTCQTTLGHLRASMEPSWSHLGPHAVLLG